MAEIVEWRSKGAGLAPQIASLTPALVTPILPLRRIHSGLREPRSPPPISEMAAPGSFFQHQISRILSDIFEVRLSATIAGNSRSHLRDGDLIAGSNVDWSRSITSVSWIIDDLDNACHDVESTGMPTHLAICSKARPLTADGAN